MNAPIELKTANNLSTPINTEAAEALIQYLLEIGGDGQYANEIIGARLDITLEYVYRLKKNSSAPKPAVNKASMSENCKQWAALRRFDPYVNKVRAIVGGVKVPHTWATITRSIETINQLPVFYTRVEICGFIREQIQ